MPTKRLGLDGCGLGAAASGSGGQVRVGDLARMWPTTSSKSPKTSPPLVSSATASPASGPPAGTRPGRWCRRRGRRPSPSGVSNAPSRGPRPCPSGRGRAASTWRSCIAADGTRREDARAVGRRAVVEVHRDEREQVARAHREHRRRPARSTGPAPRSGAGSKPSSAGRRGRRPRGTGSPRTRSVAAWVRPSGATMWSRGLRPTASRAAPRRVGRAR